jgi:hypothetical protein
VHELHHCIVLLLSDHVLSDGVCNHVLSHHMRLPDKVSGNMLLCRHQVL